MAKINVLDKQTAELIAAGEVVDRPCSVIKELVENAIDASSTNITVEIQNGGILFMRVSDNGYGISSEDVKTAFLRHATSKISDKDDLDSIMTLGFRGEALAAISSVSRVEVITKTKNSLCGTHYRIDGGSEVVFEETGCPDGTTIIVRDLFYNTPARMKFLKKDVSEGNAVAAVVERVALTHPEISFKFIRDGKTVLNTAGDGKLKSAIYDVLGRDFVSALIPVSNELNGIKIEGYVSKPIMCRSNRNGQYFILNGRYIKSGTLTAALEQAYKNSVMTGRFPAAVLQLTVPYSAVDVNVHPSKIEVRFSDEKRIFDCAYYGVKNAIAEKDVRPSVNLSKHFPERMTSEQYKQMAFGVLKDEIKPTVVDGVTSTSGLSRSTNFCADFGKKTAEPQTYKEIIDIVKTSINTDISVSDINIESDIVNSAVVINKSSEPTIRQVDSIDETGGHISPAGSQTVTEDTLQKAVDDYDLIELVGEVFKTYIIARKNDSIFLIDKHAAHERILFKQLKAEKKPAKQYLLTPSAVEMSAEEFDAVEACLDTINERGFDIEVFGETALLVRAVPSALVNVKPDELVLEMAGNIISKRTVDIEKLDWLYETIACKGAIKAGDTTSHKELGELAQKVLEDNEIMYCPHGRPVAVELTKKEIEKLFGRIQ
ncbi:MAG: DNA mismatch repair endonuclease MutL [bacterium]|nr:DNA mismatch repair endonuclease MutL [bacterium]